MLSFFKRPRETSLPTTPVTADPLDQPLIYFSEHDPFTIRDACEGVQVFGGIGSGKSSGSGRNLATNMLRNGFGGLVLTVKPDETQQWIQYAEQTGRTNDLIIVNPENGYHFNFLEYECTREGRGSGLTENLVDLFMTLTEAGERSGGGKKGGDDDAYWQKEMRKLLRNAIDLLNITGKTVSLPNIYELVMSAPQSADQAISEDWQAGSYCYDCVLAGMEMKERGELTAIQQSDYQLCFNYWLKEFARIPEKTRGTIISTFTGMADGFLRGVLRILFCGDTTFKPEDCCEGKIIILDLPQKSFNEIGTYAQIMFKYCWQRAIERRPISNHSRPVFQWIDEAQFFVNEHDVNFQTTARSVRSCNVYLTQNLPNYYYVMGGGDRVKHLVDSLLGNLTTKIFHNNTCATTNQWSAELFARDWQTKVGSSVNFSQGNFSGGNSSSEVLEYTVLPKDFSGLMTGGPPNNYIVEAIIHQKGKVFSSTGTHALRTAFQQR